MRFLFVIDLELGVAFAVKNGSDLPHNLPILMLYAIHPFCRMVSS